MRRSALVVAALALAAGATWAAVRPIEEMEWFGRGEEPPRAELCATDSRPPYVVFFFDDVESGVNGWTHGDWTAGGSGPRFHLDTYMACGGTGLSWWCGTFDYDADGGYGNNWLEYLELPPVIVSSTGVSGAGGPPRSDCPVWTFCLRHDTEPGYDFVHIQAESLGEWTTLDSFDGTAAWYDLGDYGYLIGAYDNPFRGRFLFISDGAWSDGDGLWNTVGGACAVDNIKLYDLYSGSVFFYDDGEGGGLCTPGQPEPAGDHWHIAYDLCSSWSTPHSWQCVDEADTTRLPPLMQNWLDSPWIGVYYGPFSWEGVKWSCKAHFEVAGYDGDYWYVWATFDGVNYYTLKANYGDFGGCSGWSGSYNSGVRLDTLPGWQPDVQRVQIRHAMFTDSNGTQPTIGGCCGIVFDDILVIGFLHTPVERSSWGRIKAQFQ
ncbi:MAG: hypothetical protein FJY74_04125 [Candidatus Eisenbacteria bacterium]|nr:hypothetical protein [Candidatus Eisenbacteria bacterium]